MSTAFYSRMCKDQLPWWFMFDQRKKNNKPVYVPARRLGFVNNAQLLIAL